MKDFLTIKSVYCTTIYSEQAFKDLLHENGLYCKNCKMWEDEDREYPTYCGYLGEPTKPDFFCTEFEHKPQSNG